MKNLIDVGAMEKKSSIPNKIKKSMICISIILILNGVFSNAFAGDMLKDENIPDSGVVEPIRPNNTANFKSHIAQIEFARKFISALAGVITSPFGKRLHPVSKKIKMHTGIDVSAPRGSEILAPETGIVTFSGWIRGYGNVIKIDHENGFTTLIAHNQKNFVEAGEVVSKSRKIGLVGSTGIATGPHMHVEIRYNGVLVNPLSLH